MKFRKIEIQNFRRIQHKYIDFCDDDFGLIIENNDDNKSDFMDAVSWGLTGYESLLAKDYYTEQLKDENLIECVVKMYIEHLGQDYCIIRKKLFRNMNSAEIVDDEQYILLCKDESGDYRHIEYKHRNFINEICENKPDYYLQYCIVSPEQINDKNQILKIFNNRNGLRERAIKKCSQALEKVALKQYSNISFREEMYSREIEKCSERLEQIRDKVKYVNDYEKIQLLTDTVLLKSELLKLKTQMSVEELAIIEKLEMIRSKLLKIQDEEDKSYEEKIQECFVRLVKRFMPDVFCELEVPNYMEYDAMDSFTSDELQMLALARYFAVVETNLQRFPKYNEICEVVMLDFEFLNQKLVYLNAVLSYLYEQNKQVIIVKRVKSIEKVQSVCSNTFLVS